VFLGLVFQVLVDEKLAENSTKIGAQLLAGLQEMQRDMPMVSI
jgi:4-aminobutyrate aminotransferase-like enzyme